MNKTDYVPKRAMFVVAHPDDIEFTFAGTAARWIRDGAEVSYVLCTSGDVGIADAGMTKAQAAKIREAEQLAAAEVVGAKEVIFLREPDGMLENTMALRKKLVREIRRFRPEVLVTADPTVQWVSETYINHPDHRAASGAAIEAVFPAAGQPNLFEELAEEGLTAHKVRKVYVRARTNGQIFVDITDTIDLKLAALKKHVSQVSHLDVERGLRERGMMHAEGKDMEYAEAYRVITLMSDEDFAKYDE